MKMAVDVKTLVTVSVIRADSLIYGTDNQAWLDVSVILLTNKHGTNTHAEVLVVMRLYVPDTVKESD